MVIKIIFVSFKLKFWQLYLNNILLNHMGFKKLSKENVKQQKF